MFSENILQQAILSEKYNANTIQVFYDELLKLDENYNNLLKFDNQISPIVIQIEKINFEDTNQDHFLTLVSDLKSEHYEIDYNSVRKYLMIYSDEYLKLRRMFENLLDEIRRKKQKPAYLTFSEKSKTRIDEYFIHMYEELVQNLTKMYKFAPEKYLVTMVLLYGVKFAKKIIELKNSKIKGMLIEYIIEDSGVPRTSFINIRRGRMLSRFVTIKDEVLNNFLNNSEKKIEKPKFEQNIANNSDELDSIYENLKKNIKKWYENTDEYNKVVIPMLFGIKYHNEIRMLKKNKFGRSFLKELVHSTINYSIWQSYILMGYNLYYFVEINEDELEKYFFEQENLRKIKYENYDENNLNLESQILEEPTEKDSSVINSSTKNDEQNFEILHKEFIDNWNKSFVFSHVSYNEAFKVKISFAEKTWDGKWCDISWDDQGKPTKIEIDINILEKYQNNKDAMKLFGKFLASLLIVEYDLKSTNNGVNSRVKVGTFRNNLTDLIEFWEEDNDD